MPKKIATHDSLPEDLNLIGVATYSGFHLGCQDLPSFHSLTQEEQLRWIRAGVHANELHNALYAIASATDDPPDLTVLEKELMAPLSEEAEPPSTDRELFDYSLELLENLCDTHGVEIDTDEVVEAVEKAAEENEEKHPLDNGDPVPPPDKLN